MSLRQSLGIPEKRTKKKNTQDYVPVKRIRNGIICTEDDRYVVNLEVEPVNFAMKSFEEQLMILSKFEAFLKTAPTNISIKSISHKSTIADYAEAFAKARTNETSLACIKAIDSHIDFADKESKYSSTDRKMYISFEYEPQGAALFENRTEEEIIEILTRKAESISQELTSIGNKVVKKTSPNYDTARFLYDFYNRLRLETETFDRRRDRIEWDYNRIETELDKEAPESLDVKDLLCPKSIDTNHPDYMIINGRYCCHLYIKANGYPGTVSPTGFISGLISFGEGIDVDIFLSKKNSADTLNKMTFSKMFSTVGMEDKDSDDQDFEYKLSKLESYAYIRDRLKNYKENIYDIGIIVSVYAYTLQQLMERRDLLLDYGTQEDIQFCSCKYFEEEAFMSTVPVNRLSPKIAGLTNNNITTEGVTAAYPFTAFSLRDKGGVMLGTHKSYHNLVVYNNFDHKYSNANISIFGAPGRGKTFTLLTITERFRLLGVQTFILAPDKQDEFRPVCSALDGEFIDISPSSNQRINPFDIWPIESIDDKYLYGKTGDENSWLMDKISNLDIWVKFMLPDISMKERVKFKDALLRMYRKKGITEDNSSLYTDSSRTSKKEMPIFTDLYEEICEDPGISDDTRAWFKQFVDGVLKKLNGPTNVDLENKYIVFGLEHLKGDMQSPMMFMILEFIWCMARADKTKRKIIAIDEGWKLVDGKNPQVGEFVIEIFKVIRGFGGGAIFATQSIADLFKGDGSFGNAILACSHSNILVGMEQRDLQMIKSELNLSANETMSIMTYENGQALLCAGPNHIPIEIKASKYEEELFTTRRSDLEIIAKRKRGSI